MSDKKHDKDGVKVLHVLEELLFQGKDTKTDSKKITKKKSSKDEIQNRVLLKIERAEIMAAMIAMRDGSKEQQD